MVASSPIELLIASIPTGPPLNLSIIVKSRSLSVLSRPFLSTFNLSSAISVISLSITFIIYLNSDSIFRLFTNDLTIITLGKQIIFIEFFLEFGRAINIVMTRCLVATGDVTFPVTVILIGCWGIAVGGGYLLGVHLGYGLVGIWMAMAVDECLRAIIFMIRFKSGVWKSKALVEPITKEATETILA